MCVAIAGIFVAVGGTCVGVRVFVGSGSRVAVGGSVRVGDACCVAVAVGNAIVVGVAGRFVATPLAARAVRGGEGANDAACAHAASGNRTNKKKSERRTFAWFQIIQCMALQ